MFRRDSNRNRSQADSHSSSSSASADASGESENRGRSGNRERRRSDRRRRGPSSAAFVLYVEGPRDRDILASWARRLDPGLARLVENETVILGGRQPIRARDDFRKRNRHASASTSHGTNHSTSKSANANRKGSSNARNGNAGGRGLIVLDRDHHTEADAREAEALIADEAGLELFVWGRRHIESYLLVPETLRRVLRVAEGDDRIERALFDSQEVASRENASRLHAKRLLGAGGSLSEALGVELRASEIAKAMRVDELHDDVHALFGQIGRLSGVVDAGPEVVIRPPRS